MACTHAVTIFITASEEQDESAFSSCPSEDVSKGSIPRPLGRECVSDSPAGEEHKMGAPTSVGAINTLYLRQPSLFERVACRFS